MSVLREFALGQAEAPLGLRLPRLAALRGEGAAGRPGGEAAGPAEAGPDEAGPGEAGLGEDVLSLRLRALGGRHERGGAEHEEPAGGHGSPQGLAELRRLAQKDLNCEENLADLEDPGLREHMHRRREQLAAEELSRDEPLSAGALRARDTAARRGLSALTALLKEQQMALQCACDEVHSHAAGAGSLAAGGRPHGYPAEPGKALAHLGKKLSGAASDLEQVRVALEALERDLALVRRDYEAVVDGLARRCRPLDGAPEGRL